MGKRIHATTEPLTFVEKIRLKQRTDLMLCEVEIMMSTLYPELPKDEQYPSLIQTVGKCGSDVPIKQVKEYTFTGFRKFQSLIYQSNYFLGLGGIPEKGWLSVAPYTVPLRENSVI